MMNPHISDVESPDISRINRVPWTSKQEFNEVYFNIFSSDPVKVQEGLSIMDRWGESVNTNPAEVENTRAIVRVLMKDPELNPEATDVGKEDLRMLYCSAVMRVVNTVTRGSKKNQTHMRTYASKFNIPEWVVKIRHHISHGKVTPPIESLRSAACFLKEWLKDSYWTPTSENSFDWILPRSRDKAFKESVSGLILSYFFLRQLVLDGYSGKVEDIKEETTKSVVLQSPNFTVSKILSEFQPWFYSDEEIVDISQMTVKEAYSFVYRSLREYLTIDLEYDVIDIFASVILHINFNARDHHRVKWTPLILLIHSSNKTLDLMIKMAQTLEKNPEADEFISFWIIELALALIKAVKAHETLSKIISARIPSWNKLCRATNPLAIQASLQRRLRQKVRQYPRTYVLKFGKKIEAKHPILQKSLNLYGQPSIDNTALRKIIFSIINSGTQIGLDSIPLIFHLFNPPLPKKDEESLKKIIRIYKGEQENPHWKEILPLDDRLEMIPELLENSMEEDTCCREEAQTEHTNVRLSAYSHGTSCSGYDWKSCPPGVLPWEKDSTIPSPSLGEIVT